MDSSATTLVREIPLAKLKPSPANVRKTATEAGIEELAASIAAHGLLQMPVVAPERDADGNPTGCYLVIAGERRRKALRLLVRQKRLRKAEPVSCLVREDGDAAELSLVENAVRLPMHPADQFEAFAALHRERGLGPEEIAARFGVTPAVVRRRLRLAAVSPVLIARYRAGELDLDQLMALALTDDHARQEEVLAQLSWNRSPEMIRRLLTEGHVGTQDRRLTFVGLEAFEAAGGTVLRDLFAEGQGGWIADVPLLDRLVLQKLEGAAEELRREGWKWVEAAAEHPYAFASRCRRIYPRLKALAAGVQTRLDALESRHNRLVEEADDGVRGEEVVAELQELSTETEALEGQTRAYLLEELALAGAIVSLGQDGTLRVERGLVRPEDEPRSAEPERGEASEGAASGNGPERVAPEPSGLRPLPEALIAELTAHRTAALQECLAAQPEMALAAVTHALALRVFGEHGIGYDPGTCLRLDPTPAKLGSIAASVEAGKAGQAMAARHAAWAERLPTDAAALWGWVLAQDAETRLALLAYCAACTLDAVRRTGAGPHALAHADRLAQAVGLDMTAWWEPSREGYLGRVPKARILAAVREGLSARDADGIAGLKKEAMAGQAERLLAGKGWLPEALRTEPLSSPKEASAA